MNTQDSDGIIFQVTGTLVKTDDVIALLQHWEDAYPEECFPTNGTSIDCISARMARHMIKRLKVEIVELARQ